VRGNAAVGRLVGDASDAKEGERVGLPGRELLVLPRREAAKKDAVTYNDRGKWLKAEKQKRNAKEVDVSWLKEYPGEKK